MAKKPGDKARAKRRQKRTEKRAAKRGAVKRHGADSDVKTMFDVASDGDKWRHGQRARRQKKSFAPGVGSWRKPRQKRGE